MKKAVTLLIIAVFLLSMITVPTAKSGTMPSGAVTTKFFNVTSIPTPQQINYYNKVFSLSNSISGKMIIGSDGSPMLAVFQVGSGKLDWYKWDGSQWVYQYSLSNIVPGFEEPMTVDAYKYMAWNDYTTHVVNMGNGIVATPIGTLTVTITGTNSGSPNITYTYTAKITGGESPYTLFWSQDGFVSKSGSSANYKWTTVGTKKVEVYVTDSIGQSAQASLNVNISSFSVSITGPTTGATNTNYTYTASVSGGTSPYTYKWDNNAISSSITRSWSSSGTYTVSVQVTDSTGLTASNSISVTISTTYIGLTVDLFGPTKGYTNTTYTFTASAGGGYSPYQYSWNGGAYGSTSSYSTSWSSPGTYTVTVTVKDNTSNVTSTIITIKIVNPLSVSISGPTTGNASTNYTFTANPTGGFSPYSYVWDIDVWGTSFGSSVTGFWSTSGYYTLRLTVTDSEGNTAQASKTIYITSP